MKILLAVDSFKGSLDSLGAADCMERGILRVFPHAQIDRIPIADGGEGTVNAMIRCVGGTPVKCRVHNPLGEDIIAEYGLLTDGSAVIETAAASGLTLLGNRRDPLAASTFGTGELIHAALDRGCRKIILGLGGSATNDGGIGLAQALGYRFYDESGSLLCEGAGGGALSAVADMEERYADARLREASVIAISDVDVPLCGTGGASLVFGPQKGADTQTALRLDKNLSHFATIVQSKRGMDLRHVPGAGAAGGLGFGAMTFLGAVIRPGIDVLLDFSDFDQRVQQADLVLTGEGRIDGQTAHGKVPAGVAQRAKKYGVPCAAVAGSIGPGAEAVFPLGIETLSSCVCAPMELASALEHAKEYLADATERLMRGIRLGMRLHI